VAFRMDKFLPPLAKERTLTEDPKLMQSIMDTFCASLATPRTEQPLPIRVKLRILSAEPIEAMLSTETSAPILENDLTETDEPTWAYDRTDA
jgi:hypothetical protein